MGDPAEQAGPSGRGSGLFSTQLSLSTSAPAYSHCPCGHCASIPKLLLLCCLISFCLLGVQFMDQASLESVLLWVHEQPVMGGLLFVVVDVVAIVVMFPGAILAMAAGAMFGMTLGCTLVYVGTCIGQTIAFFMGRYLLRGTVMSYLTARFPKWVAVDAALSAEGWKLITLLRLSPIVPWNVLNYALSVTGVGIVPYTLSSALAIVPWCVTFTYFGTAAKSMADILDGRAGPHGALSAVFLAISGVTLVAAIVFSTLIARRAVREALNRSGSPTASAAKDLQSLLVEAGCDGSAPQELLVQQEGVVDAAAAAGVTERRSSLLDKAAR